MIACAVFVAAVPGAALADCPANSIPTGQRTLPDGTIQVICHCRPGYVPRDGQCAALGDRLPTVKPTRFVTEDERAFLVAQLDALSAKRQRYVDQLARLDALRDAETRAARDVDDAMGELMQDSSSHALSVLSAGIQILTAEGELPADAARSMSQSLNAAQVAVKGLSAASAPADSKRRLEKAIDAAFSAKDLIAAAPLGMSNEEWTAFKRASNTLPIMLKVSQRIADAPGDRAAWGDLARNLDDVADAGGQLYAPLKLSRAAAHIVDGEVVLWLMRRDRSAIDAAFVEAQTARRYYLQRIGEVDQLRGFYQERLDRADQK